MVAMDKGFSGWAEGVFSEFYRGWTGFVVFHVECSGAFFPYLIRIF